MESRGRGRDNTCPRKIEKVRKKFQPRFEKMVMIDVIEQGSGKNRSDP